MQVIRPWSVYLLYNILGQPRTSFVTHEPLLNLLPSLHYSQYYSTTGSICFTWISVFPWSGWHRISAILRANWFRMVNKLSVYWEHWFPDKDCYRDWQLNKVSERTRSWTPSTSRFLAFSIKNSFSEQPDNNFWSYSGIEPETSYWTNEASQLTKPNSFSNHLPLSGVGWGYPPSNPSSTRFFQKSILHENLSNSMRYFLLFLSSISPS